MGGGLISGLPATGGELSTESRDKLVDKLGGWREFPSFVGFAL